VPGSAWREGLAWVVMRSSRVLVTAALLAAAVPARADDDGARAPAALAATLRSDDAARRRSALEALLLRVRSIPAADEGRVRTALEESLLREPDAGNRALAVRTLARLGGEAALAPLLRALAREEEPAPQDALVDAFGDLPAEAASQALSRVAFGTGDPAERAMAAEALGRVAGDGALRALLALSETTHPWPVQAAVLKGLGRRTDPRAGDASIKALRHADPAVRAAARESAEALLGEDLGDDPAAWERRWAEGRAKWTPPAPRPAEEEVRSIPAPRPETRTTARFYDLPVSGARVAFVVDCSQSMWGPKIESARAEMEAAVKGLRSSQRFGVVLFNEKVWTWRDDLVRATPAQKWAFVRTLPALPTKSYTNISDSLERAFAWAGAGRWAVPEPPGLDEVFLMTDGLPNRGRIRDPDRIAEAVRGWNASTRARVHTVALGERIDASLLETIAKESGGKTTRR
jgi:HEAT repeat protein